MSKSIAGMAILVLALVAIPGTAWSQATDGSVVGSIFDASGAGVPGAAVDLENIATGAKFTAKTDASGLYRFNNVPVGIYTLTAAASGFGVQKQRLTVELNKTATANISLTVGNVSTTVEVVESAPAIDTTTAQIQSTYTTKQIVDLPVSALPLGPLNVSLFSSGIASSGGTGLGEGPSIGGMRPRNNSFNVEGVDNNRKDVTGSNVRIPNEATAEVTILQNQFSAEFGHSGGGVFNTIIKSGTNEIHGSAYHYLQNRKLNAIDESLARQGIRENPRFDDNRIGGTVGGPILRNKLFYFGTYEYNPTGFAGSPASAKYAPTAEGYRALDGLQGLSKTNLDVLKQYVSPAATASRTTRVRGVDIPLGILPITYPSFQNTYSWIAAIDYNISDRDQLRSRYIDTNTVGLDPVTTPDLPIFNQSRSTTGKMFTLTEFHTFTPSLTNELRLGYNRYNDTIPSGDFSFPGLDMFPNITFENDLNLNLGPFAEAPQSGIINTYQISNNVNWTRGRHALKFGGDGRKYIAPNNFIQRMRGDYIYSDLERYLLDLSPDSLAQRNLGGTPFAGDSTSFYWFANDNWRIRQNLSVNLGLRYEYKGIAAGDKLQVLNASSTRPGLLDFREPKAEKRNFAPRIGIAYSPGTSGLTSIRAGIGMAYDNYPDNFGTLSKPPQLESTFDFDINNDVPRFLATGGINPNLRPDALTPAQALANTSNYTGDQKLPYSIQWNLGVQRVIAQNYTAEVRYLGTRGVNLFTQHRINIREPVTANRTLPMLFQRPSQAELDRMTLTLNDLRTLDQWKPEFAAAGFNRQNIFLIDPRGNSIYHGLATELTRRYSNGLVYKVAYTWSKNIDDSTADLFSTLLSPRRPQSFQDMRAERSRSFLDRTHRFSVAWVYDFKPFTSSNWVMKNLLGNWTLGGDYIYESPQYATIQSAQDANLNGDNAGDRAYVNVNGVKGTSSDSTALTNSRGQIVAYLANDPNAQYVKTYAGVHPNAGRNTLPMKPINNWDFNLTKRFGFTERRALEFRGLFINALNHPQYIPGSINSIKSVSSSDTRNHLIPGHPIFNDPTQVFDSNARILQIVTRFEF